MKAIQNGEENASSWVELDIHPLISGYVHGNTAQLKAKVLPPPTLTPALVFFIPFQKPPHQLGGTWSQAFTSHPSPAVKEGTWSWRLDFPLATAPATQSRTNVFPLDYTLPRGCTTQASGVPALENSAPGGKWTLGPGKIQGSLESRSPLCCFVQQRWFWGQPVHTSRKSWDQSFDENLCSKNMEAPHLSVQWPWWQGLALPGGWALCNLPSKLFQVPYSICFSVSAFLFLSLVFILSVSSFFFQVWFSSFSFLVYLHLFSCLLVLSLPSFTLFFLSPSLFFLNCGIVDIQFPSFFIWSPKPSIFSELILWEMRHRSGGVILWVNTNSSICVASGQLSSFCKTFIYFF